jgi:hypothetical protein
VEEPTETWELTADQGQKVLAASTADDAGLALGALANLSTPCGSGTELEVVYTYPLVWKGDNLTVRLTVTPVAVAGGRVTVEDGKGAALVSEASLNASSQVDVPVGTDTLRVILKYQMPACDPYGSSDVEYGGHTLKVDQT